MSTVSIFHIDPNQLFREGLRQLLNNSQFSIEGQAPSLPEGLKQVVAKKPRIVIIDVNGTSATLDALMDGIADLAPRPLVVVLTESFCMKSLTSALCAGVDGYFLKSMSPKAFEQSLSLVLIGEKVFPTDLAHLLVNNRFSTTPDGAGAGANGGSGLSDREAEILSCLVNGNSNKGIANSLNLTEGTVKVHLKTILKKIHARNRTQAAIWALQNGIVSDAVAVGRDYGSRQESRMAGGDCD